MDKISDSDYDCVLVDGDLDEYIERQRSIIIRPSLNTAVIPDDEFHSLCIWVLEKLGQVTISSSPGTEDVVAFKPGFVPKPELTGLLAQFAMARAKAIQTGSSDWLVDPDSDLDEAVTGITVPERPVLDVTLTRYLRDLQPDMAKKTPEFMHMSFGVFCCTMLPALSKMGHASETTIDGRSVWKATRRLRRLLRRIGD